MGSVDTVSQLLSWNQAPGLSRTVLVLDLAMASVEFCWSGPHRRKPFAWAATQTSLPGKVWEVSVADRSRVCVWEGDFGKCVFS